MPKKFVKVLRTHPDFTVHTGEIIELDAEKADQYNENGPFFGEATPEEVKLAKQAAETATASQGNENAMLPAGTPKTPAQAAKAAEKATKAAGKDTEADKK